MAGYNYSAGMSNNAVAAYGVGVKPISQITLSDLRGAGWEGTKKLAVALTKTGVWVRAEYHHSGGIWYNEVDFFDPADLVTAWNDLDESERAQLAAKPAKVETTAVKVKGTIAIWGGSRRRRVTWAMNHSPAY